MITFVVSQITFLGTDIRLLVEMTFKVNVITSSLDKIVFLWPRPLLRADIRLLVAKITVVVADCSSSTFKVVMSTSPVAKIVFIMIEITFKVIVTTSSVAKITFVVV